MAMTKITKWCRAMVTTPSATLPLRWQPGLRSGDTERTPASLAALALLAAARTLARRGVGPGAWVPAYVDDPVAFLMDAVEDPVRLWSLRGVLLYQNSAAAHWRGLSDLGPPSLHSRDTASTGSGLLRRVFMFRRGPDVFLLEVLSGKRDL
jgi:hypothetical protein